MGITSLLRCLVTFTSPTWLVTLSLTSVLRVVVIRFPLLLTMISRGRDLFLETRWEHSWPIILPTEVQLPVLMMAPTPKRSQLDPDGVVLPNIMYVVIGPAFRAPEPLKYLTRLGSMLTLRLPRRPLTISAVRSRGPMNLLPPSSLNPTLVVPSWSKLSSRRSLFPIGMATPALFARLITFLGTNGITTLGVSLIRDVSFRVILLRCEHIVDTKSLSILSLVLLTCTPTLTPSDRMTELPCILRKPLKVLEFLKTTENMLVLTRPEFITSDPEQRPRSSLTPLPYFRVDLKLRVVVVAPTSCLKLPTTVQEPFPRTRIIVLTRVLHLVPVTCLT